LDRTIDISSDEPTLPMHAQQNTPAANYSPGKAVVGRATPGSTEPTLTFEEDSAVFAGPGIVTRGPIKEPSVPLRHRVRMLRRGGRWSMIGVGVLLGCWGLFALSESSRAGDQVAAALALLVVLGVGVFLFALCRLVGRVVLERSLRRVRRSAWVSHVIAGLFFASAGITYLARIGWVVDALSWLRGVR
jgi:hypothetical protein